MDNLLIREEEGLFSRDLEGHLLRMDKPTVKMLGDPPWRITVDGEPVDVQEAVPTTDSYGEVVYDPRGNPVPRRTTVLDAVVLRYKDQTHPVPTLCFREHMTPAAVCRVCIVQTAKLNKEGNKTPDSKLVPACYQPVVKGMIVDTLGSTTDKKAAARVRGTVKLLVEMLAADHLHPNAHPANELEALVKRLDVASPRFPRQPRFEPVSPGGKDKGKGRAIDTSSPWFIVDPSACILCDRCVRGCGEVRGHFVIARAGKGADARVAFDWEDPMGKSSCVQCGECFISCPTDAITMRPGVKPSPWDFAPTGPPRGLLGRLGMFFGKRWGS